jgi:hypothetical protein
VSNLDVWVGSQTGNRLIFLPYLFTSGEPPTAQRMSIDVNGSTEISAVIVSPRWLLAPLRLASRFPRARAEGLSRVRPPA